MPTPTPSFRDRVYRAARRIPRGRVATYGQLALLVGSPRAARIVGAVMARVPDLQQLPCHRVVYGDGSLCRGWDAFGGPGAQRALLEDEGISFLPDGRVDLSRCAWNGETPQ